MNWCKIKYKKNTGWVNKLNLWGIYEKEIINIPFYQPIINLFGEYELFYTVAGALGIRTYEYRLQKPVPCRKEHKIVEIAWCVFFYFKKKVNECSVCVRKNYVIYPTIRSNFNFPKRSQPVSETI